MCIFLYYDSCLDSLEYPVFSFKLDRCAKQKKYVEAFVRMGSVCLKVDGGTDI